ncbi:hypothetical protein [Xanthomonas arboricola]|uniref:hypothetical protein n=1 Tax=Xanthomonas arboricola TaxID=56448 RepID=UPI0016197A21|nr:hypothetical protein [Xanthomonas arboricola]MBB5860225.1 hypothetical protein [Xanthomonas arboricola]
MKIDLYCLLFVESPCLTSSEWASWVQALGSILALAIAIAVPVAIDKLRHRKDELIAQQRARNAAIGVLPVIHDLSRRASNFVEQTDEEAPPELDLHALDGDFFEALPKLMEALPLFDQLGESAEALRQLTFELLDFRRWDQAIDDVLTARYNNHMRRTEMPEIRRRAHEVSEMAGRVEVALTALINGKSKK